MPEDKPFRILVICAGNQARSQMAHGWLRHLGGPLVEVEAQAPIRKGYTRWQCALWPRAVSTSLATRQTT